MSADKTSETGTPLTRAEPLPALHGFPPPRGGWVCFHCGDKFTNVAAARDHFGGSECDVPACKLNAVEGGLLRMLRDAQEELSQFRRDDTASYREFYALGADHAVKLRRAEEEGYERGLRDAKLHPEELGPLMAPGE